MLNGSYVSTAVNTAFSFGSDLVLVSGSERLRAAVCELLWSGARGFSETQGKMQHWYTWVGLLYLVSWGRCWVVQGCKCIFCVFLQSSGPWDTVYCIPPELLKDKVVHKRMNVNFRYFPIIPHYTSGTRTHHVYKTSWIAELILHS